MSLIARFKRDLAKHRGRAAVLGMLSLAFVIFGVKAVIDWPRPQAGAAAVVSTPNATKAAEVPVSSDSESRVEESRRLWRQLREVNPNGAAANVAFAFDPSFYPAPIEQPKKLMVAEPEVVPVAPIRPDPVVAREKRIREEARRLIVKTIALGNETTPSMAIINQQLMTVGQSIDGFVLTAIRSREVEVVKESVSTVLTMADGQ